MGPTGQAWLAAHPWLAAIARLEAIVGDAAAPAAPPERTARLESWACDRAAGVPLLRSAAAGPGLATAAADALGVLAAGLERAPLESPLADSCREVAVALRSPAERERAVAWIVRGAPPDGAPAHAPVVRLLAWTAARRALAAALAGAGDWCGEERWGRGDCPACGALPATARIVPGEAGRPRFLACALCGTRWRFRRIGCPFCGTDSCERLGILEPEGEEEVRIDFCGGCGGYLKTYVGEGDEELFLADWPTLHLDVAAGQRGLVRRGASLYELPHHERRTEPWPTEC